MMERIVIVPTYNESENVDRLLGRLMALPYDLHVLVVDDGSPDGTGDLVEAWTKREPRVHLMRRKGKLGLGSAYRDGFPLRTRPGRPVRVRDGRRLLARSRRESAASSPRSKAPTSCSARGT
jgi:GT2 family glycosyltransferase